MVVGVDYALEGLRCVGYGVVCEGCRPRGIDSEGVARGVVKEPLATPYGHTVARNHTFGAHETPHKVGKMCHRIGR